MRQRGLGCAVFLALAGAACSADEGGSSNRTGGRPVTPGPMVGTAGSAAAAGSGGSSPFGNPTSPSMMMVNTPSGAGGTNNLCEVVHLTAKPSTPDVLIVLDRSGSMDRDGRWIPSIAAVRGITMDLESKVRFGLALFPEPPPPAVVDLCLPFAPAERRSCLELQLSIMGMPGSCTPGNIVVPVGVNTAATIGMTLDRTISQGGTPTGQTLHNLVGTFGAPSMDPDVILPPRFVLLVTDGQPTCPGGGGENTPQSDIDLSNTGVEMLLKQGVRTYVIGYDTTGPGNEMFAAVLDGFAQRGGTGDMKHRPVEDEQSLRDEFQRIAGDVISCSFTLDKAPPRPDFVLVKIDGGQVNLNDPNGWRMMGDRTVELTGSACEKLKADGNHQVDAEVRCQVVVPI